MHVRRLARSVLMPRVRTTNGACPHRSHALGRRPKYLVYSVRPVRPLKSAANPATTSPATGAQIARCGAEPFGAAVKNSISFMSRLRKAMSEWVVHCEVNQRHMRRSHPTRDAALKDACSQLLQGHAVNRIVGPNRTITAERVKDWCAKHHRP